MMPRSERPAGVSVAESLVALGLFGLVLGIMGELTVASYRVHTRSTDRSTVFRGATTAADRMSRELRLCRRMYSPAEPAGGWTFGRRYEAGPGGRLHVVFRRVVPATGEDMVVGFRFDGQRRVLDRLVYRPDFDLARPETQGLLERPRTLATGVDGLAFWPQDPALRNGTSFAGVEVSLLAEPERVLPGAVASPVAMPGSPLRSEVRVRGL